MRDPASGARRAIVSGVELSPLTFGTMRLDRAGDVRAAAALIRTAAALGVTTFHASQEYPTWPLFVEAWREAALDPASVQLIAKIGVPHFGEDSFDPEAFRGKVDAYRQALGLDQIGVVQWLLRHDLREEERRQAIFDRDAELVAATVQRLKDQGRIGALVSFPYTAGIADRALDVDWCEGLAVYCNPLELEMVAHMDRAAEVDRKVVAIRPYAAGRLFSETRMSPAEATAMPLHHPAVVTVVASISSEARLKEAAGVAALTRQGSKEWEEALASARSSLNV